jgi:hypothetical protein
MSLTELNHDDLNKLTHFRIERLLQLYASSLPNCLIQLDPGRTLSVHCPDSALVDDLLDELDDLCNHAWLILGVKTVALYFGQEEILRADTYITQWQEH